MNKYHFVKNINCTKETGIADISIPKVICLCDKESADIILPALNFDKEQYGEECYGKGYDKGINDAREYSTPFSSDKD